MRVPADDCGEAAGRNAPLRVPLVVYLAAFLGVGGLAYWKAMPVQAPAWPPGPRQATAVVQVHPSGATGRDWAGAAAPAARGGPAPGAGPSRPEAAGPNPLEIRRQLLAGVDAKQRDRLRVETTLEAALSR